MILLETILDIQGINYTVIIASLVGITVAFICLKKKISESSSGNA